MKHAIQTLAEIPLLNREGVIGGNARRRRVVFVVVIRASAKNAYCRKLGTRR
jgi:hypothetical protein